MISIEDAVKVAKRQFRCARFSLKPFGRKVSKLPHCFWWRDTLIAVYAQPKNFPPQLTKADRDVLIGEAFRDGKYHGILMVAVDADEDGVVEVVKSKNMPDYDAWSKKIGNSYGITLTPASRK